MRRRNDSGMYDDANKASQRAILYVKIGILIGSISWVISGFLSFVSTIAGYVMSAVASAQEAALEEWQSSNTCSVTLMPTEVHTYVGGKLM